MTITAHNIKCRILELQDEFDSHSYDNDVIERKFFTYEQFVFNIKELIMDKKLNLEEKINKITTLTEAIEKDIEEIN